MSDKEQYLRSYEDQKRPPRLLLSFRAAVSCLTFFGFMTMFMQRINLSVAIISMVNHTHLAMNSYGEKNKSSISFSDCDRNTANNSTRDMEDGDLKWSKTVQGLALGSLCWGYATTQIIGGKLSLKFGGRNVFGGGILLSSLTTLAMPMAARAHYGALIALRIILGMCGGVIYPACHTVFSRWIPPCERSRLIGIAGAGCNLGIVTALFFGGYLCQYGGWPSVFYVCGAIGVVWVILWMIFVTDAPRSNRWISKSERIHIERSLHYMFTQEKVQTVPWRSILTSMPVWAIIVTHTCTNWSEYVFLTQLPSYLREVIGVTITTNGLLSGVPYILRLFTVIIFSFMADCFMKRSTLSPTANRRLFNSLGQLPLALFVIGIPFLACSQKDLIIVLLIIGLALFGTIEAAGYFVNPLDIAPHFAGVIYGISNTPATVPGMIAPSIVAALTPERTRQQWNSVFYLTSAISIFGSIFYMIFASAKLQDWGIPSQTTEEETEAKIREQELSLQRQDSDADLHTSVGIQLKLDS